MPPEPAPPGSLIQIDGIPHMVVNTESVAVIISQVMKTLGRGGEAILYSAGFEIGQGAHSMVARIYSPQTPEEGLDWFGRHFRGLGHFDLRSRSLDAHRGKVILTLDRSFETQYSDARKEGRGCHYVRGLIAGFVSALLDQPDAVCDEIHCQSRGSGECEFVVHPHVLAAVGAASPP